ncbi:MULTISPECIES: hypothetical protein [unclassified Methylococcus]|uniref:hypothetical protein n=1 Tax=unclassified Methylococcus TaxID=2618889 RepID=UPI003D7C656C
MLDGFRFLKSRTLPVLAKIGELKRDMDKAKGAQGQLSGRDSSGGFTIRPPEEQPQTLSDLGIGKAWTPSEKVAIARALEEELKSTERRGRPSNEIPDNCPELNGKESREVAAEKVAIARAIEDELKVKAAERQIALAGTRKGDNSDLRNNCYEGEPGKRSDEVAAEKAGFGSHMTYRRAKRVVDKGVPELAEAMDAGGRPAGQALLSGLASSV